MFFAYFAGHGSAETHQYFVLNEIDNEKIFWPAESKLIKLADRCNNSLKVFVVFDVCREAKSVTEETIKKNRLAKTKKEVQKGNLQA